MSDLPNMIRLQIVGRSNYGRMIMHPAEMSCDYSFSLPSGNLSALSLLPDTQSDLPDSFVVGVFTEFDSSLLQIVKSAVSSAWPPHLRLGTMDGRLKWLYDKLFFSCRVVLLANGSDIAGTVKGIPLHWNTEISELPKTWEQVVEVGVNQHQSGVTPNAFVILGGSIAPCYKTNGLSKYLLKAMKELCLRQGICTLLAPVRPSAKHNFPSMCTEEYIKLTDSDGRVLDPWLRMHLAEGARVLHIASNFQRVEANINDWSELVDSELLREQHVVVPLANELLSIDHKAGMGVLSESNIWIIYEFDEDSGSWSK